MAMELWVLSNRSLNSMAEWQSAIDTAGFPLTLSDETPIERVSGFLPARLRGQQTGFECSQWPAEEFIQGLPMIDLGQKWKYALALRWRADFNELRAAWIAGSAYAQATDGIVFDGQEGKIRDGAEAQKTARQEYDAPDPNVRSAVENTKMNDEGDNGESTGDARLTISVRVF